MGHELNENGVSFQASLRHQSQESTSPLLFGIKRRESVWSRLRTHNKKKQWLPSWKTQRHKKSLRLWMNMERPLRKWEGASLGWRNLSSRSRHMWKSMMMRRKWKNGMKMTKTNMKGTSNFDKVTARNHVHEGKDGENATRHSQGTRDGQLPL